MKTPKIINAISFVEDDLISAANDQKAKPFYIKPVFRRATAVAACLAIVAVTAFALTKKPDNNISSNNTSSNNNVSSNNSGETSSQNDNVIYVTADSTGDPGVNSTTISFPIGFHSGKYLSSKLQEKMDYYKDYKDKEVVYCLIVNIIITGEEYLEAWEFATSSEEVKALYEELFIASQEEEQAEADLIAFNKANAANGNEPEIVKKRNELVTILDEKEKIADDLLDKWSTAHQKREDEYCEKILNERLEFASQFGKKPPECKSYNEKAYLMDLTAEEINILAEKCVYTFRLSSGDRVSGIVNT